MIHTSLLNALRTFVSCQISESRSSFIRCRSRRVSGVVSISFCPYLAVEFKPPNRANVTKTSICIQCCGFSRNTEYRWPDVPDDKGNRERRKSQFHCLSFRIRELIHDLPSTSTTGSFLVRAIRARDWAAASYRCSGDLISD